MFQLEFFLISHRLHGFTLIKIIIIIESVAKTIKKLSNIKPN